MPRTIHQLFDLAGKTALITGSSRGLALQMAHALGEAGARIMLSARHADGLEAATADLQDAGIDTRWVAADCTQQADLQHLVSETLQRMGDIDILVNSVSAHEDEALRPNLRGYALLSQLVGKHSMLARRQGRIINVAPVADHIARDAVIGFTRTLAGEWAQYNITVNAICADFIAGKSAAHVPLQRPDDGEDIKGVTLLFASEAGKHITGQWLAVEAGAAAAVGASNNKD